MFSRFALTIAAALVMLVPANASAKPKSPTPMIFVHGNSGSAQQFETNAMRFDSNGFPLNRIFVYEYNSLTPNNDAAVANLDGFIAGVKEETGSEQVDVLAHSRGTTIMHTYLATPERAASVRRYVNFDGRSSETEPGGVPTLAVWGEPFADPEREIGGARNVYYPDKAHTEVTTSAEAFKNAYRFLLGKRPKTTKVVPEKPKKVKVSGRALNFPDNTGIDGGTMRVYVLDSETGQRRRDEPVYEQPIDGTGDFGPIRVNGRRHYEFEITQPGDSTIHNYPEPFERDDRFYRVLTAPLLDPFIERAPGHVSIAVTRMREFWGDQVGARANDQLSFDGVNVINPAIAPRQRRVIAAFNFDEGSDEQTDLSAPLQPFGSISFLTGADIYIPSGDPGASATVAVTSRMRAPHAQAQTTNVPSWPSDAHTVSVFFKDYDAKAYSNKRK